MLPITNIRLLFQVKHAPLSEIKCFLSYKCKQTFTSPSAWLFHLESGRCKSGMNRTKLNKLVQAHDIDGHITLPSATRSALTSSTSARLLTPSGSASNTTVEGGVVFTPCDSASTTSTVKAHSFVASYVDDDVESITSETTEMASLTSEMGGVILTPTSSTTDSSEWSFLHTGTKMTPATTSVSDSTAETITYDALRKNWPCPKCNKNFKKERHLLDHINSPVHMTPQFRCPPAMILDLSTGKKQKSFKTLSGLAQHIETGACNGGMDLLKRLAGVFEQKVKVATGRNVKLLKGGDSSSAR
jgi:hypothetical protein